MASATVGIDCYIGPQV
uniref:Uncharacterized protein n=1 Tax=Rhizophora mucronata TaxID=61149 RepID=A0A2P2K9K6_RHIMU